MSTNRNGATPATGEASPPSLSAYLAALADGAPAYREPSEFGRAASVVQEAHLALEAGGVPQLRFTLQALASKYPAVAAVLPADQVGEAGQRRYPVLHADELDDLPPIRWLVKDEVPAGQFSLFYGPSGGGKSFVALDWALTVAQAQPVIYVAAEDAEGYAARKIAWCKHHNKPAGQLYFIPVPVNLYDAAAVDAFTEQARELAPVLIVFDTLALCMVGADENSARDTGVVVQSLEAIRHATGAAVLPVHHSGKNGSTYRGSSALFGAAYTVIELANSDDVLTVRCEKAKNSPDFKPRMLRLVQVTTGRLTEAGEPETSCVAVPTDKTYTRGPELTKAQRRVLETLALAVFTDTGARAAVLQKELGMEKGLFNVLSQLKLKGYVRQDQRGDPYYITDLGKVAAGVPTSGASHSSHVSVTSD